jgi:FkbM family methyltransferase
MNALLSSIEIGSIRLWNRYWPFGLGKELPNRLFSRATNWGLLGPVWYEFQPGLWMQLDVREIGQETILMENVWEPKTTRYLCGALGPGRVFLDIGANAGYFSLVASRCVGDSGKVLAVEPNPAMAVQVRQNVRRSDLRNITVSETACTDSVEERELFIGNLYNTGNSSLSRENLAWTKSVKVACTTIDRLVEEHRLHRVDLVKIDVEGAELQVLRGMQNTLERFRPQIVMELSPALLEGFSITSDTVQGHLSRQGYTVTPLEEDCMGRTTNYRCVPAECAESAPSGASRSSSAIESH